MVDTGIEYNTNVLTYIDTPDTLLNEVTVIEVNCTESILTPGLMTSVKIQNKLNDEVRKDLNKYYGSNIQISLKRPIIKRLYPDKVDNLVVNGLVYRMSNRRLITTEVEEFTLDCCDPTLISNEKTWVSRSWKAVSPTQVVQDVLGSCVASDLGYAVDMENSLPRKDYIAENITPFQVITQQAEQALNTSRNDPSFLHYMTYKGYSGDNTPVHHFRSLTDLVKAPSCFTFFYSDKVKTSDNYVEPGDIMSYNFPCDWDMLLDVGKQGASIVVNNPLTGLSSLFGDYTQCGTGGIGAITNLGSAEEFGATPTNVEQHLRKRRDRMEILDPDKITLRLVVPFNPNVMAGRMITVKLTNKYQSGQVLYGSGDYLVVSLTHTAKLGGLGYTMIDCVSENNINNV